MKPSLEYAITVASLAHAGQKDKAGDPYILHPLRVMLAVRHRRFGDDIAAAVAVLHDVVEDTPITIESLRHSHGFGHDVLKPLLAVTRRKNENYDDFITRVIAGGPIAIDVKLEDVLDNLGRLWRLDENGKVMQAQVARLQHKYTKAKMRLAEAKEKMK